MTKCRTEISKEFRFEAAHRLPFVPPGHKCARLHGHSFHANVSITGPLDEKLGWVMDYSELKSIIQPIIDTLDHYYLNDIEGLENPTSENIASWLAQKIAPRLQYTQLVSVCVRETCNSSATVHIES